MEEMRKGGVKMYELGTLNNIPGTHSELALRTKPQELSACTRVYVEYWSPPHPLLRTASALSSSRGEVTAAREPPVTQASRSQIFALQLQSQDPVLAFH